MREEKVNKSSVTTRLWRKGYRITKIRKALLNLFLREKGPLSAATIGAKLKKAHPSVNKTTIYRNLDILEDEGFVRQVHLGDERLYEATERAHHHHALCLKCKEVKEVELPKAVCLRLTKLQRKDFQITSHSLELFGLCASCK